MAAGSLWWLVAQPILTGVRCTTIKHTCAPALRPLPELSSSAPLERYVVLAFCMQYGAGLYVSGTATLINSNIYSNEANVSVGNF